MKMKVKFLSVLVCLSTLLVCFSGCNSKKTSTIHAYWPYYKTSEEIIEASTDIYSGTLKSISFEIIDYDDVNKCPTEYDGLLVPMVNDIVYEEMLFFVIQI